MRKGPQFRLLLFCFLVVCALPAKAEPATVEDTPSQKLDRQFQSAVAQYNAGQFAEAAAQLEKLLPQAPQSFEVHELLGLVYAAESKDSKALEHVDIAVRLKPDSAAARTNLAANLSRASLRRDAAASVRCYERRDGSGTEPRQGVQAGRGDFRKISDCGELRGNHGQHFSCRYWRPGSPAANAVALLAGRSARLAGIICATHDAAHGHTGWPPVSQS